LYFESLANRVKRQVDEQKDPSQIGRNDCSTQRPAKTHINIAFHAEIAACRVGNQAPAKLP
jgi:hypothetical protein